MSGGGNSCTIGSMDDDSQEAASIDLHIDIDSVLQVTTDDSSQEKDKVTANLMTAFNSEHHSNSKVGVSMDLDPPVEVTKEFDGSSILSL